MTSGIEVIAKELELLCKQQRKVFELQQSNCFEWLGEIRGQIETFEVISIKDERNVPMLKPLKLDVTYDLGSHESEEEEESLNIVLSQPVFKLSDSFKEVTENAKKFRVKWRKIVEENTKNDVKNKV